MSAHAYSEPYTYDRRYVRNLIRNASHADTHKKTGNVVSLVPREFNRDKKIELVYPKRKGLLNAAFLFAVVGLHFGIWGYFFSKPEVPITKAEIPPMVVELYRPPIVPAEPLPAAPEPTPQPQPKKAEKPKVVEKAVPKIADPITEPIQKVVETPPQPEPEKELPVVPATANPAYLRNPAPDYPELAVERGWEGTVILNVHVLGNGKPQSIEVKSSSGRNVLDIAAVQTVKRWSFVPAKQGDTALDSWVEVPIDFRLSNT